MNYLKNKYFARWARKHGITDNVLLDAVSEFESGLFEADLGNHLFKKRIALAGRGKSAGTRTILFYQKGKKLIFCYGFEKSHQSNLSSSEINFLHKLSDGYQDSTDGIIAQGIQQKKFFKILKPGE
ncbi:MAG: type II toxin-antitoxin system RelE/ParE family toxin [Candidatus Omnitrophica bacterium]|nr:type II toxin-antitoxin system RelE/ParE family toxin [Candidatus Omnitrophota bacterium]